MDGKFIVFEGISGSGKKTQARRTIQHLQSIDEYVNVLITPEPTESKYGQEVRALMKRHREQGQDPEKYAHKYLGLFLQDRLHHQELINYNLHHGVHVVGIRYYHSAIVHQQSPALIAEEIVRKHREAGIRRPDLTIILDLNPERALSRLTASQEKGVYETSSRLRNSREKYLALPQLLPHEKIVVANSLTSVNDVFEYYRHAVEDVIGYEGKKK